MSEIVCKSPKRHFSLYWSQGHVECSLHDPVELFLTKDRKHCAQCPKMSKKFMEICSFLMVSRVTENKALTTLRKSLWLKAEKFSLNVQKWFKKYEFGKSPFPQIDSLARKMQFHVKLSKIFLMKGREICGQCPKKGKYKIKHFVEKYFTSTCS